MKPLVRFRSACCILALLCAAGPGSLMARAAGRETSPVEGDPEARAFVRNVLAAQPERLSIVSGELTAIDPDARRTRLNIKYTVVPEEDGWRGIYETEPTPARGAERLEIIRRAGTNSTFIHFPAGEPGGMPGAPVELSWTQAARPFAGSEYWLSDLALGFLEWPEQRFVRDTRIRMLHGQPCKIIESISPDPALTGYARVVSWLDAETGAPLKAEGYLPGQRRPFKVFSAQGLTRASGRWQVKELRMDNQQTDAKAVLEFKQEIR